ncbi:Bug family tripartite tricarboxylate transporter substrate binding protein [Bordetella sp. 02P26C-1]|uniref:Bug family tripartite tricarboxylate transporter substrate binding protein n=1 Tax=Bordetella sp. 02P26C-1 TaxID=2683195 RepID=UPI001354778F|nr:tripartite tricarboxylate transporter substrate binding protein [Bordetella sp. 02P26C-1]MVW79627.1 tripartite tricarboxylate transporter substrate binding protein [Bordetella sp. 02P26C-1]
MRLKKLANMLVVAVAAVVTTSVHAKPDFPNGPMKLIVPYAAGASTDTLARMVGQAVAEDLKQSVIVENHAGAGGTIAADYVKRQKPDGYTWMLTTDGILSVNPSIYKKLNYDSLKDFTPLSVAVAAPLVLAVRADSPYTSMQALIDFAKANPQKLSYGSAGVGSSQHMAGELMKEMAKVDITHVPYRGGAPAMADLLGGHIDMMFVQSASAKDLADQGKLRLLGIGSPKRVAALPDVATFDELGLKGYDSDTWYGFNMPAGADEAVVKKLNDSITKALQKNRKTLEQQGFTVVASTPEEMRISTENNITKWRDLAKKAGIYQMQ